jgi:hypothetical protein
MGIEIKNIAEAAGKAADTRPTPTAWYIHESYAVESVEVEGLTGARVYEDGTVEHVEGVDEVHYVTAVPLGAGYRPEMLPVTVGWGVYDEVYREVYSPLRWHDIFLEFAGLAEEPITPKVVLGWCQHYGVLGAPVRESPVQGGYITGRSDWCQPVSDFARHVQTANRVLRLHEALSDPDGPDVEVLRRYGARGDTPEQLREDAERLVLDTLNGILASEVHPVRYRRRGGGYVRGEAFRSLWGALWVQFDRLLDTAENDRRRCKLWTCNRIIDFEQPAPLPDQGRFKNDRRLGYATRADKEFCSKAHANRHFYLTKVKPKRDVERREEARRDESS